MCQQCDQIWRNFATLHNFKSLAILRVYLIFLQNFNTILQIFDCNWVIFHCCAWPKIEKQSSHLVTLVVRERERERRRMSKEYVKFKTKMHITAQEAKKRKSLMRQLTQICLTLIHQKSKAPNFASNSSQFLVAHEKNYGKMRWA